MPILYAYFGKISLGYWVWCAWGRKIGAGEAAGLARTGAVELARAEAAIWGHWRALCVQKGYN